jgi:hypothetical protein
MILSEVLTLDIPMESVRGELHSYGISKQTFERSYQIHLYLQVHTVAESNTVLMFTTYKRVPRDITRGCIAGLARSSDKSIRMCCNDDLYPITLEVTTTAI